MQETDFPSKPFYIQSKVNMSNYALTVVGDQVKTKPIQGTIDFLWSARKDPRGGSVLTNVGSGLVLTAQLVHIPMIGRDVPAGPLVAKAFDPAASTQLFRAEVLDSWRGINTLLNWEMKINVYRSDLNGTVGLFHWDGGADNEEWLLIEESAQVETESIDYHVNLAKADLSLPPKFSGMSVQNNLQGAVALQGSQAISTTETDSRSITNSTSDMTGRKYTQTFGAKGGVDKVFEVSASASFEESSSSTISYSDQTTHTSTETITQTVNYNVPPGKKYGYQIAVYYGKCDVPYTAQMKFQSAIAGSAPVRFTTNGVFTGVNQIRNDVVVSDLTAEGPKIVASSPLPMLKKGKPVT